MSSFKSFPMEAAVEKSDDARSDCQTAVAIELARLVYQHNDRRSAIKRQINELLGSRLIEEKAYTAYAKH